jgi:hypothetical protein
VKNGTNFYVPNGIIGHLTMGCDGNLQHRRVVNVPSQSLERETQGTNPHSEEFDNQDNCVAKNAADFAADSVFLSTYREEDEGAVPHRRNN